MADIEVLDVEKTFGSVHALGPLSFTLPSGTQAALTGESGSGKSTLLNLLACMDVPSRGRIRIGSDETQQLADGPLSRFRLRQIGYVHQFFDLIGDLTALENVQVPLWLAGESDSESRAERALERVGLGHRLRQDAALLSGGEQQRVAIARALVLDPPFILADEPSGSLDSRNGEMVLELLTTQARERRATLIVATHSEAAALRFSHQLKLRDGRLIVGAANPTPTKPGDRS